MIATADCWCCHSWFQPNLAVCVLCSFPKHVALTLRLTKFLHGKGHVVYADSYFASVQTAVALLARGTYFAGMLKTASAGLPNKYRQGAAGEGGEEPERGDTRHVKTVVKRDGMSYPVYGHAWNEPGTEGVPKKVLVATAGSTVPADPHKKKRFRFDEENGWSDKIERTVPRPMVVKEYFDAACQIDVHNHLRQGVLAIEDNIGTKDHIFRLFCTIIGMCAVDAFKFYNMSTSVDRRKGLMHFVEKSASVFLTNRLDGCKPLEPEAYNLRARADRFVESDDDLEESDLHTIVPVGDYKLGLLTESERKRAKTEGVDKKCTAVRCQVRKCSQNAYFCCVKCSDAQGKPWGVCGSKSHRDCAAYHVADKMLGK
jgi:hypothetical protein